MTPRVDASVLAMKSDPIWYERVAELNAQVSLLNTELQAETARRKAAEEDAGRLDWLESLLLRRAEINDLPWTLRADIHLYGGRNGKGHVLIYLRNEINRNVVEAFGSSMRAAIDTARLANRGEGK